MADIKKILCAVDFSEYSPMVADYAATLAKKMGAGITVVYVAPGYGQYMGFEAAPASIENFMGEIMAGAEKTMDVFLAENFAGIKAEGKVTAGYADEEVLRVANKEDMDMIVMGTHGRKGIDR
ncbi:MAG: universal stress protein, partial [Thermodesulfobacteriota bacterium]|nr:universal stress protein [Thermodesulfobacteriota bacterium]